MSTAVSPPSVFPSPPFDGEHADIILRSAEGDEFRVYKAILREASPVFRDMLALPQPKPERRSEINDDDLPVIKITESSRALDNLLRICYPVPSPQLTDMKEIEEVLEAALKYDIQLAIGEMRKALKGCCNIVGVFVVACSLKWGDEARQAARDMLMGPLIGPYHPSLERISAAVYHRLFQYHQEVSMKIATLFKDPIEASLLSSYAGAHALFDCTDRACHPKTKVICCGEHQHQWVYRSAWWPDYIKSVKARVVEAPLREDIYDPNVVFQCVADSNLSNSEVCRTCKINVMTKWAEITRSLKIARDHLVSEVKIDLSSAGIAPPQREESIWDQFS